MPDSECLRTWPTLAQLGRDYSRDGSLSNALRVTAKREGVELAIGDIECVIRDVRREMDDAD